MLNRVKVGSQVQIDDFGLRLHDPSGHTVDRFVSSPLRSVSVRSRLEVSFENRLQDELEGPLDHAISDGRNGENPYLGSSILRYFLLPRWHGLIRAGDQFLLDLRKKTLHSAFLDGFERDPVTSRCPVVFLGHLIGFLQSLHLANVGVQSPETPGWFSLRFDV